MTTRVNRRLLTLGSVLAMMAGVLFVVAGQPPADAHHNWYPPIHAESIHSATDYETFCSWSQDPAFNQVALQIRIAQGLWLDSPAYEWHGMAGGKVAFSYYQTPCTDMASNARASTELEYTVKAVTTSTCGGPWPGYSCVNLSAPYFNASVGHTDYAKTYITFNTSHLNGSSALYHHAVNHETGHALGFCDPTNPNCYSPACVDSVMHSQAYGCVNLEFPSAGDIWVGTTIANDDVPD